MVRADVVTLISEADRTHGVHERDDDAGRKVYCTVRSVSMNETYQALNVGREPDFVLALAHAFEYQGEVECMFRGVRYRILRTYLTKFDGIELTIQRWDKNA